MSNPFNGYTRRVIVGALVTMAVGVLGWTTNRVLDIPVIQQDIRWIRESLDRIESKLEKQ